MNVSKNTTHYSIIININAVIKIILLLKRIKILLNDFNPFVSKRGLIRALQLSSITKRGLLRALRLLFISVAKYFSDMSVHVYPVCQHLAYISLLY